MPAGGELTIQALVDRAQENSPPTGILLMLIDTGKGISPEVLPKIFRPFFSTKPRGSGLGLPTAKKIIEAHQGRIEAQSELGRGTKFTIRIPVASSIPLAQGQEPEVGIEWKL